MLKTLMPDGQKASFQDVEDFSESLRRDVRNMLIVDCVTKSINAKPENLSNQDYEDVFKTFNKFEQRMVNLRTDNVLNSIKQNMTILQEMKENFTPSSPLFLMGMLSRDKRRNSEDSEFNVSPELPIDHPNHPEFMNSPMSRFNNHYNSFFHNMNTIEEMAKIAGNPKTVGEAETAVKALVNFSTALDNKFKDLIADIPVPKSPGTAILIAGLYERIEMSQKFNQEIIKKREEHINDQFDINSNMKQSSSAMMEVA